MWIPVHPWLPSIRARMMIILRTPYDLVLLQRQPFDEKKKVKKRDTISKEKKNNSVDATLLLGRCTRCITNSNTVVVASGAAPQWPCSMLHAPMRESGIHSFIHSFTCNTTCRQTMAAIWGAVPLRLLRWSVYRPKTCVFLQIHKRTHQAYSTTAANKTQHLPFSEYYAAIEKENSAIIMPSRLLISIFPSAIASHHITGKKKKKHRKENKENKQGHQGGKKKVPDACMHAYSQAGNPGKLKSGTPVVYAHTHTDV